MKDLCDWKPLPAQRLFMIGWKRYKSSCDSEGMARSMEAEAAGFIGSLSSNVPVSTMTEMRMVSSTSQTHLNEDPEFMVVDLMDKILFRMQQMAALCPTDEMESMCLEQLFDRELLQSMIQAEILVKETEMKEHQLEIEYYKSKVLMEQVSIEKEDRKRKVLEEASKYAQDIDSLTTALEKASDLFPLIGTSLFKLKWFD